MMVSGGADAPIYYLLDTNILLAYIRAGKLGEQIERTYKLSASPYKPLISVVTVGEILAVARKFGWGDEKILTMNGLLKELIRLDINDAQVLEAYAEPDEFARTHQTIGKNDVWIAATARVTGATLLTTDRHFDQFHPKYIKRIWIDEAVAKPE
ncbi:MAG: type II toxin-antitoxin system VapC family toxin [Phycisphaerae bacterium]|nr:type II toxin-antitoxin system VapC family toxin [Phycisphaerae bacterium]